MLPPNFLVNNIDRITQLYSGLHTAILVDIVKHMRDAVYALGETRLSVTARYQVERLNHAGMLREDMVRRIARYNSLGREEVERLFEAANIQTQKADASVYEKAGLDPIPIYQSERMLGILKAGVSKALGDIENFTGSTVATAQHWFLNATNLAYNKIISGAFNVQDSLAQSVDELAKIGIYSLETATGKKIGLEAGVRRAVLTGVNQTAGEIVSQTLLELDADLCRVSAHLGARNKGEGIANHESWQGKIYSLKGKTALYEDFTDACGYGKVLGIYGANCRHSHGVYIEGVSPDKYDEGQLDEWANATVPYNGKEIPYYDATQMLRGLEAAERKWKRRLKMKEAASLDTSIEEIRIEEYQREVLEFTKQTGLTRQYIRERIGGE